MNSPASNKYLKPGTQGKGAVTTDYFNTNL